jgi:hypothetical protein
MPEHVGYVGYVGYVGFLHPIHHAHTGAPVKRYRVKSTNKTDITHSGAGFGPDLDVFGCNPNIKEAFERAAWKCDRIHSSGKQQGPVSFHDICIHCTRLASS